MPFFRQRRSILCVAFFLPVWISARADEKLEGIACRSVHLWWEAPEGTAFYNEITPLESAPGTYFCVCGFHMGYYGIQELADGRKVLIFSVWDPGKQNDRNAVPEDRRVRLHYQGDGVRIGRFGGEGTGGQSFYDYDWKIGQTYRFLMTAETSGTRTAFTSYFFLPETKEWKRLATFSTLAGGRLLRGYYSFIEDFRRNRISAAQTRKAEFANGAARGTDGRWTPFVRARFTADRNPVMNINAALRGNGFLLSTGGDIQNTGTPLGQTLQLPSPPSAPPPQDLPALP